jgi:diguanylate cyclase (GGDEF)-like protein
MKILVVDDDEFVTTKLTAVLEQQNYVVEVAADGKTGLTLATSLVYDLILIATTLPQLDGSSLCQTLRSHHYTGPIVLLTEPGNPAPLTLAAGADDYITKPIDLGIVVARMRALLQRVGPTGRLAWGQLQLNPSNYQVTYANHSVRLNSKEVALLELFLRNPRRVFSCGAILDHLWAYADAPSEVAVRTHIQRICQQLQATGAAADLIETVYGIGYRLKPEPSTALTPPPPMVPPTVKQQTLTLVTQIWERYRDRTVAQIDLLEQACIDLDQHALRPDLHQSALQIAHSLAGSLGTFGFAAGSQLARKLEQGLQQHSQQTTTSATHLLQLVILLRQAIEHSPTEMLPLIPAPEPPLLLIIDPDRGLAEELAKEAQNWGLKAMIALDLKTAWEHLYHQHPNVILLDLAIASSTAGRALLTELHQGKPAVPVVVFTAESSLTQRIEVLRQGGQVFLQKPVPPAQVLEKVNQVLQHTALAEAQIMIVDDDPQMLTIIKTLLEPWGLRVTALADPRQFWETLEICHPDLLILDIDMPYLNGIELCQVVRHDARWNSLPILFITAHTEPGLVNQVFTAGADDFVYKPIVGPELINRILNRLERIKLLRQMAETDPLTLVANRHKSTQDLEEFLRLANRHHQPMCMAILDLDHFKQINDRYGHAMGDAVLRHMGHLLRQSFRREDVVARWGGEEFVVGLYGVARADSIDRLTHLLKKLQHHQFGLPEQSFQVTFSAGVAEFPQDGNDILTLYRAADAMLYRAKQAGRARVL